MLNYTGEADKEGNSCRDAEDFCVQGQGHGFQSQGQELTKK